ncbi:hypothetical protein EUTSA_v10029116mg [Eutrema salsugineum]|uniref:Uncharacterized protein n=1 Tax=Eutrema salsugineum TaxID=72664 RepID=V4L1Y0_EUTSA|nr:hypothetical protein EUTSA_v10029116mg [Eutrema salsugineum]
MKLKDCNNNPRCRISDGSFGRLEFYGGAHRQRSLLFLRRIGFRSCRIRFFLLLIFDSWLHDSLEQTTQ